jgi:hypothetical protein
MVVTLTIFAASAEPMGTLPDTNGQRPSKSVLTGTEPLAPVSDVTRSSLTEGLTMVNPSAVTAARNQQSEISGVSLISATNGKVLPVAVLEGSTHAVRETTLAVWEAGAEDGRTATLADEVVAEANAAVSQVVDPTVLSVATTNADTTPIETPVTFNSAQVPNPEPSSLLLVGSIFIGCGLFRRKKSPVR